MLQNVNGCPGEKGIWLHFSGMLKTVQKPWFYISAAGLTESGAKLKHYGALV